MADRGAPKLAERSKGRSEAHSGLKKPATGRAKPASARKSVPAHTKTAPKSDRETPYHHGDLHEELLRAAKRVAEREGISGLTLRAVAREAGVSHAAPAHHFGDVTGLLSELAALGFQKFSAALGQAACGEPASEGEAKAKAGAYVAFAHDNPCLFQLMFRAERLDHDLPVLKESAKAAFAKLAAIVAEQRGEELQPGHLTLPQAAGIARIWSMVHGFAMLHLDGRLKHILDAAPGVTEEMLLAAMLKPDKPA